LATRALTIVALIAMAGTAAAEEPVDGPGSYRWYVSPPEAPPPVHRYQLSIGGHLRFTHLDLHDESSKSQLLEYGWASARSPVMPGLSGEAQYLLAPIIDVGVSASWAKGDHAAGLDTRGDRVSTKTTRFAIALRMHVARGRPFIPEPRVDVGVVRRSIALHGMSSSDALPFVRAAIDWRLGTRSGGAMISVGYTLSGRASSSQLDPAIGGLDVGVGPYLRF
jgi:hypothetical protein